MAPEDGRRQHLEPIVSSRGFRAMPDIPSAYGGFIRAYESSAASAPHLWVLIQQPSDLNDPNSEPIEAVVHLELGWAATFRDQLDFLIANHYHQPEALSRATLLRELDWMFSEHPCCWNPPIANAVRAEVMSLEEGDARDSPKPTCAYCGDTLEANPVRDVHGRPMCSDDRRGCFAPPEPDA